MTPAEHAEAVRHAQTRQPGEAWRDFKARRDWETCAIKRALAAETKTNAGAQ